MSALSLLPLLTRPIHQPGGLGHQSRALPAASEPSVCPSSDFRASFQVCRFCEPCFPAHRTRPVATLARLHAAVLEPASDTSTSPALAAASTHLTRPLAARASFLLPSVCSVCRLWRLERPMRPSEQLAGRQEQRARWLQRVRGLRRRVSRRPRRRGLHCRSPSAAASPVFRVPCAAARPA